MHQTLPFSNASVNQKYRPVFYFQVMPPDNSRMAERSPKAVEDVENRRRQLQKWINDHFDGVQAKFVEKTGINQGELSGLLKTKSFGSVKARNIEAQAEMPDHYLERREVGEPVPIARVIRRKNSSPFSAELCKRFAALDSDQKEVIVNAIEAQVAAFERQNGPRKSGAG